MPEAVSRKALLRGKFRDDRVSQRPPWALPEGLFLEACDGGGACREACPEKILLAGPGGRPEVSFERGECTFCEDCVKACPTGALSLYAADGERRAPWTITATVRNDCMSLAGVTCRVCGDQCESRAIRFQLAVGGVALPVIDSTACSGCGACVAPCPTKSISIN